MITAEIKRKVVADWRDAFPDLAKVGERRLLRVVGPLVVGLEIITGPPDLYRPYNVVYPLWRDDVKECLDYPDVLYEFVDERGVQVFIEYNKHAVLFRKASQNVEHYALFPFYGNISLSSLLRGIDKYAQTPLIKAQGSPARARLLYFTCLCSLYSDRMDLVNDIVDKIQLEKELWDMERFSAILGDFDIWFNKLISLIESDGKLHQLVEANLQAPKLKKLSKSILTPE